VEPWLQAGKYAAALMSDLPRRNGWTLAERAGDRTPDRMQRLLSRAVWDVAAVMAMIRRFAVAGLDQAARLSGRRGLLAIGAIDETSQVKQGECTAGAKRHYLGCAGKVANGITTVHLACAREGTGHALIAARQWIPREQIEDAGRAKMMRLPPDLAFRTKGQLAIDLLGEVLADVSLARVACAGTPESTRLPRTTDAPHARSRTSCSVLAEWRTPMRATRTERRFSDVLWPTISDDRRAHRLAPLTSPRSRRPR
jgi:SRSO17 transposase